MLVVMAKRWAIPTTIPVTPSSGILHRDRACQLDALPLPNAKRSRAIPGGRRRPEGRSQPAKMLHIIFASTKPLTCRWKNPYELKSHAMDSGIGSGNDDPVRKMVMPTTFIFSPLSSFCGPCWLFCCGSSSSGRCWTPLKSWRVVLCSSESVLFDCVPLSLFGGARGERDPTRFF